jgi:hypothetical protein
MGRPWQSLGPSLKNEPNYSLVEMVETYTMDYTVNINCSIPCFALREKNSEALRMLTSKDVHEKDQQKVNLDRTTEC